ncbi:MAG TPA: FHA domain-containing protein [Vicinamibacterales bacterium]|nr:FHA domain-containing protein [Vicinamibacterales bacterium]
MKLHFDPFVLDTDTRQLTRDGGEVHLSLKALDLLAALARERPNVVAKETLQQRLWPDTFVSEANLSNLIAEVRQALGDSPRGSRYIRTVHRVGYAFCADARGATAASVSSPVLFWIELNGRRFPLAPGEHVIGRDPDVAIRLDSSTVSRRHARVVISETGAILEDFGSKNGTFHREARVNRATPLTDGVAIRIGSHLLTFRERGNDTTETSAGLVR